MIKTLPKKVLGIDFGLARLGLALSDERQIIASPWMTLPTSKRTEETVAKLLEAVTTYCRAQNCEIEEIVIGMPFMMSGRAGFMTDEVKHFIQLLAQIWPIPIHSWDERLSTIQADRSLREANLTRKRRAQLVDTVSAAVILQSYLDHKILIKQAS